MTKNSFVAEATFKTKKFYQSIDRYVANPGGHGTFDSGHKVTVVIWPIGFRKHLYTLDV